MKVKHLVYSIWVMICLYGLVRADSPEYHQLIDVMSKNLKSFNDEV